MRGRYGFDAFGRFLLIASFVLSLIGGGFRIFNMPRIYYLFWALNTAGYIFAVYRILSRNILRREAENQWYLRRRERVMPHIDRFTKSHFDRDYLYKVCPFCHTKLRLRRVRGKHTTRCPKCGSQFKLRVYWGPLE